jgi:hypothetical protein
MQLKLGLYSSYLFNYPFFFLDTHLVIDFKTNDTLIRFDKLKSIKVLRVTPLLNS